MASRKRAVCLLAAVVAAAAAASMASAKTTPFKATAAADWFLYDNNGKRVVVSFTAAGMPMRAALSLSSITAAGTATPLVASNSATEKETRPVVGSVDMTLPNGTLATMTLHLGEDAVTEVRRWLHAHNAVGADVDMKFRYMLAALKTAGVVAVTPDTLLGYVLVEDVYGGVTYQLPLLTTEPPEEAVLGFLRRMDLTAASTAGAVRAARERHAYEMARRAKLSLTLPGSNFVLVFNATTEDLGTACQEAAMMWPHLSETVRAGLHETVFVARVARAMFRAARVATKHAFVHAPWDATIPFSVGNMSGELSLKAGDNLRDVAVQTCATNVHHARRMLDNNTSRNRIIIFECARRLLDHIQYEFLKD